jgi:hypothetical protein
MHRWFIAAIAIVHLAAFLAYSASQNPRLALHLLEGIYVLVLIWAIHSIHRRRVYRRLGRSVEFRSRELRCRIPGNAKMPRTAGL